jgi:BirA family biotin operon repressor/biotin-[acetyl-CoA-carboxylase] ligase
LSDALSRIRPRLGSLGSSLHFFETISSTNDCALSLAAEGAVVIANAQTAGRGRRGHTWFSPAGSGLYVSVVLAPRRARLDAARALKLLTLTAGVAIAEGIQAATGLRSDLKWPNDLQLGGRKVAGILAEASGSPAAHVVVGYGVNVGRDGYPPELGDRATSLEQEAGRPIDRLQVLAETLAGLAARYADLIDARYDAILDAWRSRAPAAVGARVSWTTTGGPMTGVTEGIDAEGALLVRTREGAERIVAGELRWET